MALDAYMDTIHRCFRCGYCKYPPNFTDLDACPAYARFRLESFSAGGRLWLLRAWMNGELEYSDRLAKVVFSCTACANCAEQCPYRFGEDVLKMMIAGKGEILERGLARSTVKRFLENMTKYGNPYGEPRDKRADWAGGNGVEAFDGHDWLLHVGCVASYDPRAGEVARALAALMKRAEVSVGMLGVDEGCDGNDVATAGEEGLFEHLARSNVERFESLGVQSILALSPHAYNAFRNDYPRFGGEYRVVHASQLLRDLLAAGRLEPANGFEARVSYHDPCFLGRWNSEYDAPRAVLKAVPGVELVEMPRKRANGLCCGGGGGNAFTDLLGGSEDSPARQRVRMARATGADVLATACPTCLTMLEDAVKTEGFDDELAVRDVSEILAEACGVH
jgi:Fe-S oxidoreductase